ncbi:MAG: hypothetical protein DDG60_11785 [Anaerolineae bacterium]|nr:MAG: hypothetical protein DDG60_11785 [Anaerolineae bacterium]
MSKRLIVYFLVVSALLLAACQRTASTPIPTPEFPSVPTIDPGMQGIQAFATQTAIALTGTPEGGLVQPESPALVTPDPNVTQTLQTPIVTVGETPLAPIQNPTSFPQVTPLVATGRPTTYTLQKGEFPFCIARRFDVDPDELLALNGLTRAQSYFTPGTVLKIPQTEKRFPGERALLKHPTTYTVLSGDTIYSIACKYGDVDPLAIAAQNGLQPPYTLTVGTQITIP